MRMVKNGYHLMNEMMVEMYRVPAHLFNHAVKDFIRRNNELLGDRTAIGFRCFDNHFGGYKVGKPAPQLHTDLRDEFLDVWTVYQTDIEGLVSIKHFFINALNKTSAVEDLEKILPVGLHQHLEAFSEEVPNGTTVLMEPAILDAFVAAKQSAITKIQEVLALNMLIV